MLSRLTKFALVGLLAGQVAVHAQGTPPDLAAQIAALQARLAAQEKLIADQNTRLAALAQRLDTSPSLISTAEVTRVAREEATLVAEKQLATGGPVQLSKGIDRLKLKGDFRGTFERRETELEGSTPDTSSRDRYRYRLRLGGVWETKTWEAGVGLASGGNTATSANADYSSPSAFSTDNLSLDYAYAKHKWETTSLTIGQHVNPYTSTWVIWDTDVRPAGISGQYDNGTLYATTGAYVVRQYGANETAAWLGAVQVGLKETKADFQYNLATALYRFSHATVGNNETGADPVPNLGPNNDYDLTLWDLYAKATIGVGDWRVGPLAHYAINLGADDSATQVTAGLPANYSAEANDQAWLLALTADHKKLGFELGYASIEGDSVYGQLNDSNFGAATAAGSFNGLTDVEGPYAKVSYKLTDALALQGSYYATDPIERTNVTDSEQFKLELQYRF